MKVSAVYLVLLVYLDSCTDLPILNLSSLLDFLPVYYLH